MYRRSERSKRIDISSYGIPSRKQPLRFSVCERCPIKFISFFRDAFSFASLVLFPSKFSLREGNSFCFVNCSILAIRTIAISNVLSILDRTFDIFFFWFGEKHFFSCKFSTLLSVSTYNFSLRVRKCFYILYSSRHTLGYYPFSVINALLSKYCRSFPVTISCTLARGRLIT